MFQENQMMLPLLFLACVVLALVGLLTIFFLLYRNTSQNEVRFFHDVAETEQLARKQRAENQEQHLRELKDVCCGHNVQAVCPHCGDAPVGDVTVKDIDGFECFNGRCGFQFRICPHCEGRAECGLCEGGYLPFPEDPKEVRRQSCTCGAPIVFLEEDLLRQPL